MSFQMFFLSERSKKLQDCAVCGNESLIANTLEICKDCLRKEPEKTSGYISAAHNKARERMNLPIVAPHSVDTNCSLCNHMCGIGINEISYCGLRYNKKGNLISLPSKDQGILDYYLDPLPCNCCAAWFCPAGTGAGFPEYAAKKGKEYGHHNLSIFFYGCSFDCLFCQNQNHKNIKVGAKISTNSLVDVYKANKSITCVCYFGGSPEPHFPFAIHTSEKILEVAKEQKRIARICWEWNGFGKLKYVEKAAELSLVSGGNIKFDLKAWDTNIHRALTSVGNKPVLENFRYVGEIFFKRRPELPVLNATTLLVPGYIDEEEVENIAAFIASINENIPYSLLGFYPHFEFTDMPLTSREQAENCYRVAKKHLKNVNIGNKHLLA